MSIIEIKEFPCPPAGGSILERGFLPITSFCCKIEFRAIVEGIDVGITKGVEKYQVRAGDHPPVS
jgi:hypothetical protein